MIVTATKYSLAPERISAGTRGSYGVEKLEFAFSSDWDGLVISVVFYPSRGKPVKIPYLGGEIDIPPEVMAYDGAAQYVLAGTLIDEEGHVERQIISLRGYIDVENTLPARGGNSGKITPDVYDKFLDEASKEIEGMVEEALAEAKASGDFQGEPGTPGEMLESITQKTNTDASGNVSHTITVTTNTGREESFTVSDGKKGEAGAVFTPLVSQDGTLSWTNNGGFADPAPVNIKGPTGETGADGVSVVSVEQTTVGVGDGSKNVVTITLSNGQKSKVEILNGSRGERGKQGDQGVPGNGIASVRLNADYTLTLTFEDGTSHTTTSIRGATGATGQPGKDGEDGESVSVKSVSETTADGGENVIEFTDGKSVRVRNGKSGVYVGSEETMPEGTKVRVDPNGRKVKIPEIDPTLTQEGYAADAKAVGDAIAGLPEFVTPQMYGAAGDGVTDDTDAFNAALSAAAGKYLHVPAGKYLIKSTLYIHDNTTLSGDGAGSIILTKIEDGYVFNGIDASGNVSSMLKYVVICDVCFDNKVQQDSATKLQQGNFIDKFRGSTMCRCKVSHYYNVFGSVEVVSTLAHNRFAYIYHCFCAKTTDSIIDGNYINASVFGNPYGSRCFESSCNSLSFTNNFVDYFRNFIITRSTTGSKFVGNTFSRIVSVFHDVLQNFTVTGNTFSKITYVATDWKALTEEQREQLANETWSVIKFDDEFITTAHHMRNVAFTDNVSIHPVDNYIYVSDKSQIYAAKCEFRGNTFTTDGVTPSGVNAHFINFPILDKYSILKYVYFDFWDMKTYKELPDPVTKRKPGQPIFSYPYMRAVYNGNIYININDSWQKETHIGGRVSATGEVLGLSDTVDDKLQGLVLYGKSTQNGIPTPDTPVPIVSIGDDGAVDVVVAGANMFGGQAWRDVLVRDMDGTYDEDVGTVTTNSGKMHDVLLFGTFAPKTQYTIVITGYNKGDNYRTVNLRVHYKDGGIDNLNFPNYGATKGVVVYTTRVNSTVEAIRGQYAAGSTVFYTDECGIFKGRIVAEDFKPYTAQTMSISTPDGLRGIPVTSGGNFTDADGQQWICDEIDLSSGIRVSNVGMIESYANETIEGAWMSSTGELSEGAMVLYELHPLAEEGEIEEGIETPLPEDEIAAYGALHTYRQTTNIYSNDKVGIAVDYIVAGHNGVDWSLEDIALGVHRDGLVYIFIDGKPVGNGISLGQLSNPQEE